MAMTDFGDADRVQSLLAPTLILGSDDPPLLSTAEDGRQVTEDVAAYRNALGLWLSGLAERLTIPWRHLPTWRRWSPDWSGSAWGRSGAAFRRKPAGTENWARGRAILIGCSETS